MLHPFFNTYPGGAPGNEPPKRRKPPQVEGPYPYRKLEGEDALAIYVETEREHD